MKKEIKTNTTINVKIGDYEFNLTKEEAEELYNSLKNSLGKNQIKITSPLDDYKKKGEDVNRGYWDHSHNRPYPTPQVPKYPNFPEIICETQTAKQ